MLPRLLSGQPEVREAASAIVADDEFNPAGTEDDPACVALVRSALEGTNESRQAAVKLIGRNRRLGTRPEIVAAVRRLYQGAVGRAQLTAVAPMAGRS